MTRNGASQGGIGHADDDSSCHRHKKRDNRDPNQREEINIAKINDPYRGTVSLPNRDDSGNWPSQREKSKGNTGRDNKSRDPRQGHPRYGILINLLKLRYDEKRQEDIDRA